MENLNKELPKALTIEDLKQRIGKPVFVVGLTYGNKEWRVLKASGFAVANTLEFTDCSKITTEHQDKFRFFDEEVTEEELKEILDAEEKTKKITGYESPSAKKIYYFINTNLKPSHSEFSNARFFDVQNYKVANCFNDENLTENIARAERLKYQLRRFAALNGGIPSKKDWNDYEIFKYFIVCNYKKNQIYATYISTQRDSFQIYFKSKDACEKAIVTFKDELIWYFTEFEEQLY